MRIKTSILLFAACAIAAGVFFINAFATSKKGAGGMPPAIVEVAKVQSKMQSLQVTATGTLRASQGVMMRSEVSGRVTHIFFKPGDNVTTGTRLLQLNQDILLAKQAQYDAELKLAHQDYERMASLYKTRTISKSDLDNAFATLKTKEAQVAGVKAELKQTNITAPFSGKIGLNLVNAGDYIQAGQDLVSLQAVNPIDAEFAVPEVFLGKIVVGNPVAFHSAAFPNQSFVGKVYAIDTIVNQKNRSVTVRARIANPEEKLIPGMFAEVSLALGTERSALAIPQVAVFYETGTTYVYKVMQNKAAKTKVTLGERDQNNVIVINGLVEGDVIITAGQLKAHDGGDVVVKGEV